MRKKTVTPEPQVVAPQILEQAKKALAIDTIQRTAKCSVCGGECSPSPEEQLCWVCRRLKISAWRDADLQAGAQE